MFSFMPDDALHPVNWDEVRDALGYALRFNKAGKAHRHAHEMIARIAANVLVEHLELSGFVVMKRPAALAPSTTPLMPLKG